MPFDSCAVLFHPVLVVAHCLSGCRNALKSLCTLCGSSSLTFKFFEAVRILCKALIRFAEVHSS